MTQLDINSKRPLILLTTDLDKESEEHHFIIRTNYVGSIEKCGGLPLIVPILPNLIDHYLDVAHGVIITGSAPGVMVSDERKNFHIQLIQGALKRKIPLLGICHGMQLIGECLGGTLVRDDPSMRSDQSLHKPLDTATELAHEIHLEPDSLLAKLSLNQGNIIVNSLHMCNLKEDGCYKVAARAMDGVVEAIEGKGDEFCIGIQWHPEYLLAEIDYSILRHFIHRSIDHQSTLAKIDAARYREYAAR